MIDSPFFTFVMGTLVCIAWFFALTYLFFDDFSIIDFFNEIDFNFLKFEVF